MQMMRKFSRQVVVAFGLSVAAGFVEAIMAEKTQALTAGLPIPPGMKLPF